MAKKRNINWDKQPLGKKPDGAIAKRLRCSVNSVYRARRKRGVPAYRKVDIDWDKVALGSKPDGEIGDELGVTSRAVQKQRKKRGIPSYGPRGKNFWKGKPKPTQNAKDSKDGQLSKIPRDKNGKIPVEVWDTLPLGEMTDSVLAKAIGCACNTVTIQRIKRGIPAHPDTQTRPNRRSSKYDWDNIALGQKSDREIAEELGCSYQLVWEQRSRRGIAPFRAKRPAGFWDEQPLGKVSDEMLAMMIGCNISSVRAARCQRGIPPYGRRRSVRWDNS